MRRTSTKENQLTMDTPEARNTKMTYNDVISRTRHYGDTGNDAMLRQISEAVQIDNVDPEKLMNTRAEWNMTRVPRATIA